MKDDLGKRIKEQYEDRTRFSIPRRTFSIIRLDGKAFHTYTKNLKKPFDNRLTIDIDGAVIALMKHIQGAKFAYCQSDEISILLTDFEDIKTNMWFDGNIQKITSVSASIMTAEFNRLRFLTRLGPASFEERPIELSQGLGPVEPHYYYDPGDIQVADEQPLAYFDARLFTIPDRIEVMNYFIWRNQDCMRNAVSMVAQSFFSHKELHKKSTRDKLQMLEAKQVSLNNYWPEHQFGRFIIKNTKWEPANCRIVDCEMCATMEEAGYPSRWTSFPAWKFSADQKRLLDFIPEYATITHEPTSDRKEVLSDPQADE